MLRLVQNTFAASQLMLGTISGIMIEKKGAVNWY